MSATIPRAFDRPAVRDTLRLSLFSAYALVLLAENILHFEGSSQAMTSAATCALWLCLLADYVAQIVRAGSQRRSFLKASLGYPLYLLTLPFVTAHNPWVVAVPLIVGFVIQVRLIAAGRAVTFALALTTFIAVLATAGVVYAEQDEPTSRLREWPDAATWAIARLIHLRGYNTGNPKSPDGIALSFVLAVTGLLVAALLTAQLVSWVVGQKDGKHDERT